MNSSPPGPLEQTCPAAEEKAKSAVRLKALCRRGLAPLIIFLLALALLPLPPGPPTTELDPSLGAVLTYAHQRDVQFGTDLLSTYGPLGFLLFPYFYPEYGFIRLLSDFGLSLFVALGLWLAAAQLRLASRIAMLALFAWGAASVFPRGDLILNAGLLSWTLLCLLERDRRFRIRLAVLLLLATFAALAKTYFFITGFVLLSVVAVRVTIECWCNSSRSLRGYGIGALKGAAVLASFAALLSVGWVFSGQRLSHLPLWIVTACTLVRGYTQALGWERPALTDLGFQMLALVGAPILIRIGLLLREGFSQDSCGNLSSTSNRAMPEQDRLLFMHRQMAGLLAALAIAFVSFTSWRHGFVRADYFHAMMFIAFLPVLLFGLELTPPGLRSHRLIIRCAVWLSCLIGVVVLQTEFFPGAWASAAQPLRNVIYHLGCLSDPAKYHERMSEMTQHARTEAQLPTFRKLISPAPVDVFGQRQLDALYNDLLLRPRPVFQSHAACNAALMRLNRDFYLSNRAPEFVLFELDPIDSKLPPLEDAMALRELMINYEPVAKEGRFLLLRQHSTEPARLTLLTEAKARPGQRIELQNYNTTNLWLEIELQPTWLGWLRQAFFQPPVVRVAAWQNAEKKLIRRQRAPPAMLAAGFLASPLLLQTGDVSAWFENGAALLPAGYSVELNPGSERFWKPDFVYRLYRIENELGVRRLAHPASPNFQIFRYPRWRPTRPPPGGAAEQFALVLMTAAPLVIGVLLVRLAKRVRVRHDPLRWPGLLVGNALVFAFLFSVALLVGEIWFRFFYDTTDALGYTKVCERWVERHWQLNNLGCRDDIPYSLARPAGKRRVTFIGDSFTAGHGIKNVDDRFGNRVRRLHPDWDVQVIANVGLDTGGERALLERITAAGYELGDVVLVYCLNDIGDLLPKETVQFEEGFAGLDQSSWWVRNSYCINFLAHRLKAASTPQARDYFGYVREAYRGPAWKQQEERLQGIRDFVQAHGGRLYVVTFPFLHKLGPNYPYKFVHQQLNELWKQLGVPALDLAPVYEGSKPAELTVNRFDAHPNEHASELAAAAINPFLLAPPAGQ